MLWLDAFRLRLRARFDKRYDKRIVELHIATLRAYDARKSADEASRAVLELRRDGKAFDSREVANEREAHEFILNPDAFIRSRPTPEYSAALKRQNALELLALEKLQRVLKDLPSSGLDESRGVGSAASR